MRIGILQTGHVSPEIAAAHGDFADMFERLLAGRGYAFRTWNVVDMEFPDTPHDADAWLITGSKHGAYEDHLFIPPLEALVRAVHAARVPLVGICFGHQIVAQAMGGRVEKYAGGWALGRTDYVLDGIGAVQLNAWHQDQVTRIPPGATPAGTNGHCRLAALNYGERMWTVQPHPEFSGAIVADYVPARRGTADYPDALMDRAAAQTDLPVHQARLAEHIGTVFACAEAQSDANVDA